MRRAAWAAWAAAVACVGAALWLADMSTAASVTCFAAACLLMGAVLALDAPRYAKGGYAKGGEVGPAPTPEPYRLQREAAAFHDAGATGGGVNVIVNVHMLPTCYPQKAERAGPLGSIHSHRGEFGPR